MSGDDFFLRSFLSTKKEFFYEKNTHTDFIPDDVIITLWKTIRKFEIPSIIDAIEKANLSYKEFEDAIANEEF